VSRRGKNNFDMAPRGDSWQISRKISMGIIVAILLQSLTAIWWAAKLDTRVMVQEQWVRQNTHLSEIVFRLEERIISLQEDINELQARLNNDK
jgi:hypothetical protein